MKSHLQRYLSGHGLYFHHKALDELYTCTVHPIYHASLLLLGKEKEAMVVAAKALRLCGFFINHKKRTPTTIEALRCHAVRCAVKDSMDAMLARDSHAFSPPENGTYRVPTHQLPSAHTSVELLQSMPPLSRFLFVLSTLGGCDRERLGEAFHLDDRNLDLALEAQPFVVEALVRRSSLPCDTYEQFVEYLNQEADTVELPTYVQECLQTLRLSH